MPDKEWVLEAELQGVSVYYRITRCDNEDVVYLKFENKNQGRVTLTWQEEFRTDGRQVRPGAQGQKSIRLDPGTTSETDCAAPQQPICLIRARQIVPTHRAKILHYSMSQLQVSR